MKLAFFDAKPYDRPGFDAHAAGTGLEIRYFETKLGEDTVQLARGFDGVCVFVNDTVNAKVADELYRLGVRVIALRCAGFNNVDTRACRGRLRIFRVPAYSPYAVAEHAMALLLTVNRHTHKAYIRTRDFNFSQMCIRDRSHSFGPPTWKLIRSVHMIHEKRAFVLRDKSSFFE